MADYINRAHFDSMNPRQTHRTREQFRKMNSNEAPKGYYPMLKESLSSSDNVCNHCDWRSDCTKAICSCMAYDRKDGVGVIFKEI
jgi:hypothetical protein